MQKTIIKISDMAVTNNLEESLVTYALGSCLGLILYDSQRQVAGLLHCLLPEGKDKKHETDFSPLKFVDTAVPLLFKACYQLGSNKHSLKAYAFGCASIQTAPKILNIGERNFASLNKILWKNNVFLEKAYTGGNVSRTVEIQNSTGLIILKEGSHIIEIEAK